MRRCQNRGNTELEDVIKYLKKKVPVMAHLGLQPQNLVLQKSLRYMEKERGFK